jgi:hypothetical protein
MIAVQQVGGVEFLVRLAVLFAVLDCSSVIREAHLRAELRQAGSWQRA